MPRQLTTSEKRALILATKCPRHAHDPGRPCPGEERSITGGCTWRRDAALDDDGQPRQAQP